MRAIPGSLRTMNAPRMIATVLLFFVPTFVHSQRPGPTSQTLPAALTITTEPNAIIWIDDVRRGTTDASGKLALTKVSPGRHSVRVRANGFKETTSALLPGRRVLAVKLVATTDEAELLFQQA